VAEEVSEHEESADFEPVEDTVMERAADALGGSVVESISDRESVNSLEGVTGIEWVAEGRLDSVHLGEMERVPERDIRDRDNVAEKVTEWVVRDSVGVN
jgi:uncharacterized protein (UPF0261 family)